MIFVKFRLSQTGSEESGPLFVLHPHYSHRIDTGPEVSLRRYFVRNFTSADDVILECTRTFFIGKHRYKVTCALQGGVVTREKISDVFPQPKHIGVSLLVQYLFCVTVP